MFANDYEDMGLLSPVWQNLHVCIRQILTSLPLDNVKVTIEGPDVDIFADLLLKKVFYNLVDNSLRYGGDQLKTITFSSQEKDAGLEIVIEDDCAGICGEDKNHLFTRGFRKHTGLGLFLSREILLITGITITENGFLGKGARFEIVVLKTGYRFV